MAEQADRDEEVDRLRNLLEETRAEVAHWRGMHDDATAQLRLSIRESAENLSKAQTEIAQLLSPERDTTGLTYGDKIAWRNLLDRAESAESALEGVSALVDEATGYSVPYRKSRFLPIDSAFTDHLRIAVANHMTTASSTAEGDDQ